MAFVAQRGSDGRIKPLVFEDCYVVDNETGCWLWIRSLDGKGYGMFGSAGRAHRWSYKKFVGPIPGGFELDHLCRVRRCVNPAHLEPVTHEENVRRSALAPQQLGGGRYDVCKNGHSYTEENTYHRPDGYGRDCMICRRARNAVNNKKVAEARARRRANEPSTSRGNRAYLAIQRRRAPQSPPEGDPSSDHSAHEKQPHGPRVYDSR